MKWVKCSERMPKEEENVIVFTNRGHMFEAILLDEEHDIWSGVNLDLDIEILAIESPTHWVTLPKSPEKE